MAVEISKLFAPPKPEPPKNVAGDDFLKLMGATVKHGHKTG